MASQSKRGSMFLMKVGFMSISICSSSASWGCSGKAAAVALHVLRAQVRKLRVRSFILSAGEPSSFCVVGSIRSEDGFTLAIVSGESKFDEFGTRHHHHVGPEIHQGLRSSASHHEKGCDRTRRQIIVLTQAGLISLTSALELYEQARQTGSKKRANVRTSSTVESVPFFV